MEKILELATRYPELLKYTFGLILLLAVASLVCLYFRKAKARWAEVLKTALYFCDMSLIQLEDRDISMLEMSVTDNLRRALDLWIQERKDNKLCRDSLNEYFNGGNGVLYEIENVYARSDRLEERSDVDNLFNLMASTLWRYYWLHTFSTSFITVLYMDITRLFSRRRGNILDIYSLIMLAKNIEERNVLLNFVKQHGFLSIMQRIRPKI